MQLPIAGFALSNPTAVDAGGELPNMHENGN